MANPPSVLPAVANAVALAEAIPCVVRPKGQLLIGGLWLGMSRSDVEANYGAPSREAEPGSQVYRYAGSKTNVDGSKFVFVGYDDRDKVVSLSGCALETAARRVLSGVPEPKEVRRLFGSPDKVGWAGVAMCEGEYAGYRYDNLNLTITFSLTCDNNFWLGAPLTLSPDEAGKRDDDLYNLSLRGYFKRWGNPDLAFPGNR